MVLLQATVICSIAQNVGIGTSTPNASAQLDISSTTKGMLAPRMTIAERDAIVAPVQGLLIFNTNSNSFQYYNGTSWSNITHSGIASGTNNQIPKFLGPWGLHNSMITDNGKGVGIGTTTPGEKLQVAGNIKADTVKPAVLKLTQNAGNGKILTSDATGNASWQAGSASTGNIGFGVWGDCATNGNISEYNPVSDTTIAANDKFGFSVSISGNWAVIGSPRKDVGANLDQGGATFYQYEGNEWVQKQNITGVNGAAGDNFGTSVSISGNYAIIGAPFDDFSLPTSNVGTASIYQYNGTSWVFMQEISDGAGFGLNDNFGSSVSISGNYAIVGSPNDDVGANTDQGSACMYRYNGTNWVFMQKITDATGAAGDEFGTSVSISGTYVIAGAANDDVGANSNQGSAGIYNYNGTNWVLMQKINGQTSDDLFGYSVSLSGNDAIIGAPKAYNGHSSTGSASIYRYNGTIWNKTDVAIDDNVVSGDNFGGSVSISGNYAIVGNRLHDIGSLYIDQGSSTIFIRVGNFWPRLQNVTDPVGRNLDNFGASVSVDGATKRFLIGVDPGGSIGFNPFGKAIFGKIN